MLDDLLQNHLRRGMAREEVLRLLGKPGSGDHHTCLGDLPEGSPNSLCYTVSVGMDPCTLLLGFDKAGRFVGSSRDCS